MAKEKVYQEDKDDKRVTVYVDRRAVEVESLNGEEGSRTRYSVEQRCNQFYLSMVNVENLAEEKATRINSNILGVENIDSALDKALEDISEREKHVDIRALKEGLIKALLEKEKTND